MYKYLILNRKLGLPGVGSFYIEAVPAKMDFVAGTLIAPKKVVNFKSDNITPDRAFYDYLISEMKLNESEVIKRLTKFGQQVRQAALQNGISLPGIGMLKMSNQDDLSFYPETIENDLMPEINLSNSGSAESNLINVYDSGETKIILQKAAHPEEEKIEMESKEDYWWVYAIVLALMGLGALLFYYI